MNGHPAPRARLARETRTIAADLVTQLLTGEGTTASILIRPVGDRVYMALLIADGVRPARVLFGHHDGEDRRAPERVVIDTVDVDTVASAIQQVLAAQYAEDGVPELQSMPSEPPHGDGDHGERTPAAVSISPIAAAAHH